MEIAISIHGIMENSAVSSAPPFRLTFEDLEQPTYVSLLASEQIYWWWNYHSQHAECIIHNPSMSVFASLVYIVIQF